MPFRLSAKDLLELLPLAILEIGGVELKFEGIGKDDQHLREDTATCH